jgi:large repetitive protein
VRRAYLAAAALIALGLGVPLAGAALDPTAPVITSSTPTSPANNNNPTLNGTADPGSLVTLYTDACLVAVAGTGTADGNGDWHIAATVGDDSSTTFYAGTAAPPSCSGPFPYVEDSTPPPAPTI